MKSVIAQGATVSKAVEEALKKAENPKEFFIKILQESQSGFLGFGSVKAKIALFFKTHEFSRQDSDFLSQDSYKDLFDNKSLQRQIDQQERDETGAHDKASGGHIRELRPRDDFKPKMKRRSLHTGQNRTKTSRPAAHRQDNQKNRTEQETRDGVDSKSGEQRRDHKRTQHRSPRRPRQGARWGTNRDTSKNKDDKDKE